MADKPSKAHSAPSQAATSPDNLPRFRIGPWLDHAPTEHGYYLIRDRGFVCGYGVVNLRDDDCLVAALCDFEEGARFAPLIPRDAANTVRVRIAVATLPHGDWAAVGDRRCGDDNDADLAAEARAHVGNSAARVTFVEASVPLPESPRTVEGEVAP